MAPLYDPYRNDNHNSTISKWLKLGFATSQDSAGYAVRIARIVAPSSKGLRPILSENAPITGSQKKFDRPMHTVTSSATRRSEEHTSELQSLMRISYAVFCLNKK